MGLQEKESKKPHVVVISGHARHGKDTVAAYMEEFFRESGKKVLVTHYADLLKYICRQIFGWNGEKDENGRQLLQFVGTDIVRRKQPDFWVSFLCEVLSLFGYMWDYVIIPDARFPNEIDVLKERGYEVTHIRIERPSFDSGLTEEQKNHPSETALDAYGADVTIRNDGTLESLKYKAYAKAAVLTESA